MNIPKKKVSFLTGELASEALRRTIDPAGLGFASTAEVTGEDVIIGQERGVEAFRFGMGMQSAGYNIFVTGRAGLGKLSMVRRLLKTNGKNGHVPDDLCYVHNFRQPDAPVLLRFAAGRGRRFKDAIQEFLDTLKREVPRLFESPEYLAGKNQLLEDQNRRIHDFFSSLESKVKDAGFVLVNLQVGQMQQPELVPLIDNEPTHMLKVEDMVNKGRFPKAEFEQLQAKYRQLKEEIDGIFLEVRALQKEIAQKSEELDRAMFRHAAQEMAAPLTREFDDPAIIRHVEAMLDDMAEHLDGLRVMGQNVPGPNGMVMTVPPEAVLHDYQVNLLVDNSEQDGPPVIVESFPTYRNLFGGIERVVDRSGMWRADYTRITAGSFIKANGGCLVLNLLDAIMEPGVWQTLKRALKASVIEIQTFDPYYFITSAGLKPEPIAMNVKVVVLATPELYQMLQRMDPDVENIFKIWADFDSSMPLEQENIRAATKLVKSFIIDDKLKDFDAGAVAQLMEYGVRLTGRRERVSTAFPRMRDIMGEAAHFAEEENAPLVTAAHVRKAMQGRKHRAGRIEDAMQQMLERGSVFIDVDGKKTGQVNGLAVYMIGENSFGKPSRITATVSIGREGIINIEREADLSGSTHNKGMLILSGYLRHMFAQDKPLTLTASIAFEQSYGGVDGDSASSTELYALLSCLSGVPIDQGIAVTGSVNQFGEIQPIGGVNEKIEGFYHACLIKGLTGQQGVLIPAANTLDLMLDDEVIEAVKKGEFHIWAVTTIAEGIERLTGIPAGQAGPDHNYPPKTIFGMVDARLRDLATSLKNFGKDDDDNGKKKGKKSEKKEEKEKDKKK